MSPGCAVSRDLAYHDEKLTRAAAFEAAVESRLETSWLDLELIANAIADTDVCTYRRAYTSPADGVFSGRTIPANITGAEALRALREKRFDDFGRLVYAAVDKELREDAADAQRDADDEMRMDAQAARGGY